MLTACPSAGCHTWGTESLFASTLPSSRTSVHFSGITHVYILIRLIAFSLPLPFLLPKEKKSILRETTRRAKTAKCQKTPTSQRALRLEQASTGEDSQSQSSGYYSECEASGESKVLLLCSPWLAPSPLWPREVHSPHCGRRTHSSSSHRTSHLSGGWRTRYRSFAQSCYPLPHPGPHLPRRAGAAGRPGRCVQTCALCTRGPCCRGESPRGKDRW